MMPPVRRIALRPVKVLALIASIVFSFALLAGCGGDDPEEGTSGEEPTAESESACADVDAPASREVDLDPPPKRPSAENLVALVDTSCGSFEIELATEESPKTTASFEYLAENGVFDGTPFHRILPGFIVQAGDPAGTGTGPGPGYSVDEKPRVDAEYTRGVVAMAKSPVEPPGRSGSQFFIVTTADAGLAPDFAIVGEVSDGFETIEAIEGLGDPAGGDDGTPLETAVINSVTIERE